jgi:hypothetical protein
VNYEVYIFIFYLYFPAICFELILVRTVIELVVNGAYYTRMYSQFIGLLDIAIKAICKNYTYSELYEIAALCNILRCNIQSIYPRIDFREDMEILNNSFRPTSPIIANCSITIFWSHVLNEIDVRAQNNMTWSPNHFVPLISPPAYDDSDNISRQPVSKVVVGYRTQNMKMRILKIIFLDS